VERRPGILASHAVDLTVVALVTIAILIALAVWFKALGPAGHGVDRLLGELIGLLRYLVPALLLVIAVLLVVKRDEVDLTRVWIGGGLGLVALSGLCGLAGSNPSLRASSDELKRAGGYLGALIGHSLSRLLGSAGATVLLVALGIVAVLIGTGIPLKSAGASTGRGLLAFGRLVASWWSGASARAERGILSEEASEAQAAGGTPRLPFEGHANFEEPLSTVPDELAQEPEPPLETELKPIEEVSPRRRAGRAAQKGAGAISAWRLPPARLLSTSQSHRHDQRMVDQAGEDLIAALLAHGVETSLVGCTVGPTVTRFELELGPGVKVSRVTSLHKDIAYAMASPDVRILAPIPGRSAIGVEVPNRQRQLVTLGDLLATEEAKRARDPLAVALGRDIAGRTVMFSLAEFPHVLISGATGAGKSSAINSLITSLLMRTTPDQVRLILVDPKRVELGQYNDLPQLLTPVVVDPKKAANALAWAVKEMERRYDLLAESGVRDITSYHEALRAGRLFQIGPPDVAAEVEAVARRARAAAAGELSELEEEPSTEAEPPDPLPFIVIVVDELNDLMMVAARDVEESVVRIAQMARAVGIHLVLATQRPSVDVITGVIKANVPSRMAFSVSSLADSRVILDQPGAERLVGKGDMLLLTASSNVARRIQAPWVSEDEVKAVAAHWRAQGGQRELAVGVSRVDEATLTPEPSGSDDDDQLLGQARELVIRSQLGSTSMLQRKLRVGFARAGRLMDLLEQEGVVGPSTGSKARVVLISPDELDRSS
jgi:S-DNA-T family DNA segregation ATPase FtsK/SpoIIIE